MAGVEIVTVSGKGQVVLPKKIRNNLKITQGTKLLLVERKGEICLKKADFIMNEKNFTLIASEKALAKQWLTKEEDEAWKNL